MPGRRGWRSSTLRETKKAASARREGGCLAASNRLSDCVDFCAILEGEADVTLSIYGGVVEQSSPQGRVKLRDQVFLLFQNPDELVHGGPA